MAVRAAHAQEAVFQAAAFEVSIEFARYILRQGRALGGRLPDAETRLRMLAYYAKLVR
jgi:hypothetical protein